MPEPTEYDKNVGIDKVFEKSSWQPTLPDLSEVHEKPLHYYLLNFGPQHPAAHGVLRLVLELDNEVSLRFEFNLKYRSEQCYQCSFQRCLSSLKQC